MKTRAKLLLPLMLLCIAVFALALTASAETKTGTCGENLTYILDTDTGVLTISGTGAMTDWTEDTKVPWYSYCSSIRTVQISKAVTSIGAYAFSGCSKLTSIIIPSRVTSIGKSAFSGCSGLNAVYITDLAVWCRISFGNYGANPLYYAHNLYLNSELVTDLVIPDSVTSIEGYAFCGCSCLTSVTIPCSATSVGNGAFLNCSSLNAVYITDLAAWYRILFGNDAANPLYYAHNLYLNSELVTDLVIPDSVTSIGSSAFLGCSSLTSITIPDSVTSIGRSAFLDCSSLNAVYITDLAAWYRILFGNNAANPLYYAHNLYLNDNLVTDLVIPDNVTDILNYAFSGCSGLTSVTIPESVTSIGDGAFSGCSGLTSVTIPESVTSIEGNTFSGCSGLTSVTIPESVTSVGRGAFSGCSSLTNITIPDGVTSIGDGAFSGCSGLTSVTIPESVTSVGRGAFSGCSGLTSVTIPESVTSVGRGAFSGCSSLTNITIPDSVTSIGSGAFEGCSNLVSITIPFIGVSRDAKKGYNQLFGYVFGCTQTNGPHFSGFYYYDGKYYYYYGDIPSTLHSITVTSIATIPRNAFNGCSNLTSITILSSDCQIDDSQDAIPSTATIYGYTDSTAAAYAEKYGRTFVSIGGNCGKNLTFRMDLDMGILSITGAGAMDSRYFDDSPWYAYRTSIRSIRIASGATSIGDFAFYGCSRLTSITIPDSVTSIGSDAFYGCSSLASITILSPDCQIDDSQDTIPSTAIIYGYTGSTAAAYAEKYGCTFVPIGGSCGEKLTFRMDFDTGILSITGTGAMDSWYFDDSPWYAYRTSIRSIQIASGATSIGDFAFDGCSNLVDVMIAETVESIGDGAFDNCTSLAKVTILNDTCKIPDRADAFPTSVTIHGNAGSTAEAYAKKYNRAFAQIEHTHVYAEDYTVDVPAGCTTAGAKSRHCTVEGCTETIDSTVIPAAGHKFGAWTIIREATLDDTGERTHTCEVCGTSETETMPKRVRGDADGDGAVMIRDALLTLRAVLDGAAMDPYMDANGDGKLMLADVLLILRLAVA